MARIAGVNIPTNKRVLIALQYIHGIGQKNAADIMEKVKIPVDRRVNQLTDQEVLQIIGAVAPRPLGKAPAVEIAIASGPVRTTPRGVTG